MMSDPNTQAIGQSPESATIIANTGIMIERPIRRPAMKLPACRNLASEFFMIRSSPDNHDLEHRDVSVRHRTDGFRAEMNENPRPNATPTRRSVRYRTDTAASSLHACFGCFLRFGNGPRGARREG
jgi:hypothetical protein